MPAEFWTSLLVNAGVAACILAVMFAGIYKLAAWIGKRIDDWVVPLVTKHIAFVTMLESQLLHMQAQNADQTKAMATQAQAMEKMIERLEQLSEEQYANGRSQGAYVEPEGSQAEPAERRS